MPSLGEAYGRRRADDDRRGALVAGAAAFGLGIAALLAGIVLVSLEPGGRYAARHIAGGLAGVGLPLVLLGIVAIIPAHRTERIMTGAGALLCIVATGLFWEAYPGRWFVLTPDDLTLEISLLYVGGGAVALWFVMRAVATFKTRNDPYGTVTLEIERGGETRVVEVDPREIDSREELRSRASEEAAGAENRSAGSTE
jgi:hypothetical protein